MKQKLNLRKNVKAAVCFWVFLTALYLVTRYGLNGLYTPEWAARNIYWLVSSVILVFAVLGRLWFSGIALGGYLLGLAAGELFGGFRREPPSYHHYGWLILICVFLASCAAGWIVQSKKGRS